ncbi:MAG: N-acetyl-gamma-glutamyl-phosphate reductase [Spirochaetota bacterium]
MIKAGIVGSTGYTGIELVRLLQNHPQVEIVYTGSRSFEGRPYAEEIGAFREHSDSICSNLAVEELAAECDVIFMALPHGLASLQINEAVLTQSCIIDLGADYRLKQQHVYEQWYGVEHGSPHLLSQAVYGLPELIGREKIARSNLIANPGCYTTCSILSLAPLAAAGIGASPYIIDARSGVSGAGRKASQGLLYGEVNESIKAYKLKSHRHTPEIEQELSRISGTPLKVQFTPHLVPMNRGILTTAYIHPVIENGEALNREKLLSLYNSMYSSEHFIRLLPAGILPETRWVKGSNHIDIAVSYDERTGMIIVVAALDNLMKGAAGQAVQNMNIRFGCEETAGLEALPIFP